MKEKGISRGEICPAQAGVIPEATGYGLIYIHLSRASGGDPILPLISTAIFEFVPRKRG